MATLKEVIEGDLEGALREICTISATVLDAERTSIWLLNEKETELHCRMFYEASLGAHAVPEVRLLRPISYFCCRTTFPNSTFTRFLNFA